MTVTVHSGDNCLTVEIVEKLSARFVLLEAVDGLNHAVRLDLHSTADVAALRDVLDRFLVGVRPIGTRAVAVSGARSKRSI